MSGDPAKGEGMEADIILKEDEIKKAFEAASRDFLSYLDKSMSSWRMTRSSQGSIKRP